MRAPFIRGLEATEEARARLAREGFDPEYGARPLRRTIQPKVENPVARGILQGESREGDTVVTDTEEGSIVPRLLVPSPSRQEQGGPTSGKRGRVRRPRPP